MDFKIAIALQLFDNFSKQLFEAKKNLQTFNEQVQNTDRGLKKLAETMKKAFDPKAIWQASERLEDFSARAAQAVALPLAGATKMMRDFAQMEDARVQMEVAFMTKSGLPEELQGINKQIEELGVKLPGSATDFYRVATALKATGMSAKDILAGGLKATSYAWVLFKSETSPEQAAEYMQEFANAFKIPAGEFMGFIDQLQRVKFASGLTLSEIAYSTKYFSSELNQLGVTGTKAFNLMGAWIGTLKQFGIKGETAGTSIRSVLQNIVEFEKNLKKLSKEGISLDIDVKQFYDEKGAFELERFLITLRERLSQIQDPLQRMTALKTLFDTEGMRAIAPLLAKSKEEALNYLMAIRESLPTEEFERLKRQIEEGGFSGLEEMARRMQEQASLQDRINRMLSTLQNVWESFQGTLIGFGAIIGEFIAPPLKVLFNTLNTLFGKIGDFLRQHKTLSTIITWTVGGFIGLLGVLATAGVILSSFIKLMSFAFAPFVWLMRVGFIKSLTSALFANMAAFVKWAITGSASTGWLKMMDFWLLKMRLRLFELIGILRLKIVALWQWTLALARLSFAGLIAGIKSFAITALTALRAISVAILTTPVGWVIAGITALVGAGYLLWRHWDRISKALVSAWNWLKENWRKVLQVFLWINPLTMPVMALGKLVKSLTGINLFEAGKKIVESLWKGIQSFAMKPVEAMKGIVQKIRNLLPFSPAREGPLRELHRIRLIETIAETIKPAPLFEALKQALEPVRTTIQPFVQPVSQVFEPARATPLRAVASGGVHIVVNLGGINISGKVGERDAKEFAFLLKKEIESVLKSINFDKRRRQY